MQETTTAGPSHIIAQEFCRQINHIFTQFNYDACDEIITTLQHCKGTIFFTGIGKSGIIAQKIAATLRSSGTKSLYLSAQDALHGDIGIITSSDIVCLLSKSGESTELIELCPFIRNKKATLIAIVSNSNSRLAKACNYTFTLPLVQEICPFGMVPTTSTISLQIFGDILAIALMQLKQIQLHDFIENHPSGKIGRAHLLKVKDLMVQGPELPQCQPTDRLEEVLIELSNKQCGCVCVLEENRLLGIFTDGDLRRALQQFGPKSLPIEMSQLMTKNPLTIHPEALVRDALHLMEKDPKHPVTSLIVVDGPLCIGLIKMHDIIQAGI